MAADNAAIDAAKIHTCRPDAPLSSRRQRPRAQARTVTSHPPTM